jgi:hypothetical protein
MVQTVSDKVPVFKETQRAMSFVVPGINDAIELYFTVDATVGDILDGLARRFTTAQCSLTRDNISISTDSAEIRNPDLCISALQTSIIRVTIHVERPIAFTCGGDSFTLLLNPDLTIADVRARVADHLRVPAESLAIVHCGDELSPDVALKNLQADSFTVSRSEPPSSSDTRAYRVALVIDVMPRYAWFSFGPDVTIADLEDAARAKWSLGGRAIAAARLNAATDARTPIPPGTRLADVDLSDPWTLVIGPKDEMSRLAAGEKLYEFAVGAEKRIVALQFTESDSVRVAREKLARALALDSVDCVMLMFAGKPLPDCFRLSRLRLGGGRITANIKDLSEVALVPPTGNR